MFGATFRRYWPWWVAFAWLLGYEAYAVISPAKTLSELVWLAHARWPPLPYVATGFIVLLLGHFWFKWWKKISVVVLVATAAAAAALASCRPTPHPATSPTAVALTVAVTQAGAPVAGALVTEIGGTPAGPYGRTDTAGQLVLQLEPQDFTVCAQRDDASPTDRLCAGVRLHSATTVPIVLPGIPKPPRASGDRLLDVKACLANLVDSAGRVVWTSALPGASDAVWTEWLGLLRDAGCTHVPIGGFTAGPSYPGVAWSNPDLTRDAAGIRRIVERLLDTPASDGYGFRPIIFADNGDPANPKPRLDVVYPTLAQALDGLDPYVIVVPAGFEPVVGAYRSSEVSYALEQWHARRPNSVIGYHGSPTRLVGSSNPLEADDPWHGDEAGFYTSHGGQYIQVALYQTPHGSALYRGDCNEDDESGSCWLNRWQDYVSRLGTGYRGWRVVKLVLFETCAYERFRQQVTNDQCRQLATYGQRVADKWGVRIGFGNGLPLN